MRKWSLWFLVGVVVLGLCVLANAQGLDMSVFEKSSVNWKQFEGTTLNLLLCKHPMQATFEKLVGDFEKLTGIKVNILALPEQQFFEKQTMVLTGSSPEFDIVMTSPMLNSLLNLLLTLPPLPRLWPLPGDRLFAIP